MDDLKGIEGLSDIAKQYLSGVFSVYDSKGQKQVNFKTELDRLLFPQPWSYVIETGKDQQSLWVELRSNKTLVGCFELAYFPMCRHLMVSTKAEVGSAYRGKGIGKLLHRLRLHIASTSASMLICTVRKDNLAQIKILEQAGWEELRSIEVKPFQGEQYEVGLWAKKL